MLSNNNIGGIIPEDLPVTLQNLYGLQLLLQSINLHDYSFGGIISVPFSHSFLSANQLTGSIPSSLSKLKNLAAM
jgi:hypothetical protein